MSTLLQGRGWLAVLALSLSACQPSGAKLPAPAPQPTEQDIASAFYPEYVAAAHTRSECLGRLVFEVPEKPGFEWGLPKRVRDNTSNLGFSPILRGGQDAIRLANVVVVVASEATADTIREMQRITGVYKSIGLKDYQESIRIKKSAMEELKGALERPDVKSDPEKAADYRKGVQEYLLEIENYERRRQSFEKDWHPTDWGLPDSTGYIAGPTLYAFVLRNGFAFQFMSTGGENEAPFEQRVAAFKDLLSRFEYRALHQVPTKPGLCIPHGFINDNGEGHFSAEVSYRFTDSPGVIYTLATAVEGERNFNANEPLLEATARSTVAGLMGNVSGRKLTAIGPKGTRVGARSGVIGGIYTAEGTPGYSVYAGARGWDHSHVLPFISLNMRSFDPQTAPQDLQVNPPPFEQSMRRFEQTLGSLRTRNVR